MMLLIVSILALTLCGTAAAVNTSYITNVTNSGFFEMVLTAIKFIGIGAICSKSGKSQGDFDFDNDGDFDGFDGSD